MNLYTTRKLPNYLHSALLVAAMLLLAMTCGWMILGPAGSIWALATVVLVAGLASAFRSGLVLSLYGAKRLEPAEFPGGYALVGELAGRAELPFVPSLYYVPSNVLNAFTVGGRNSASIALTDGMIRTLSPRELAGVLAHEIGHIVNRDLWLMALADAMSRLTVALSYAGLVLILLNLPLMLLGMAPVPWAAALILFLAPTLMSLLQLALSRAREYEADMRAAALTGDPRGVASALARIERRQGRFWEEILYPGRRIPDPSLLRTHPPTEERVQRLLELEQPANRPVLSDQPGAAGVPANVRVIRTPPRLRWWGGWY